MKIVNPFSGEEICEVREDSKQSVAQKFIQAKGAQKEWAKVPAKEKKQIIEKFVDLVDKNKEMLSTILTKETGKPISQSRNELKALPPRIQFFLDNFEDVIKEEVVFSDEKMIEKITYEPLGVIANISAWNYPYFVGSNVYIPALLTGNACLYKPSENSTLSGLEVEKMLHEAGVPPHVFQTIVGAGEVGGAIMSQPLEGIFFTGSYGTGMKIAKSASEKLMKTQLELGGKDPVYICEDVDVASVAAGVADGAFYNAGQSCCSVERIYVNEKIYDKFIEYFSSAVRDFVVGNPMDEKTYIGPLARSAQIQFLENQVQDALKKGAILLNGGTKLEGNFFSPTVLINVKHSMDVMKEESFGPIIGIQKVKNDEEAVTLMNDTVYGLTASVYSQSQKRAELILDKLNSGSVYWNCCDRVSPRLPWTGRGHSGIGSTLSKLGIQTFVQPKAWHNRLLSSL